MKTNTMDPAADIMRAYCASNDPAWVTFDSFNGNGLMTAELLQAFNDRCVLGYYIPGHGYVRALIQREDWCRITIPVD